MDYNVKCSLPNLYRYLETTFNIKLNALIQICYIHLQMNSSGSSEDSFVQLMRLGPYEIKNLLFSLLANIPGPFNNEMHYFFEVKTPDQENEKETLTLKRKSSFIEEVSELSTVLSNMDLWRWRRKIDGSLSRIPENFFKSCWKTLSHINGILIDSYFLGHALTKC
ncbi:MAG: hypothetical protein MHPSP_000434, partial [Paramarteilia canceri]